MFPQNILDFLNGAQEPQQSGGMAQQILSSRFEPTAQDAGNAALSGISNNSYVNPQSYADTRMGNALKQLSTLAELEKLKSANLPQGYRISPQSGQAELIPGVDPSFGKKMDPYAIPTAVYDPRTGQQTFVPRGQLTSGNFQPPTADPNAKPQTAEQANAALFATRMNEAQPIIDKLGPTVGTNPGQRIKAALPGGNYLVNNDYQQLDQAERNFVNATLRKESGAAINQSEFDNAVKQYFPRPGDKRDVIEQKRLNRLTAIQMIGNAAGPRYQPQSPNHATGIQPPTPEEEAEYMRLRGGQ